MRRGTNLDITVLTNYFHQYGILLVFIIVFLEYMNLPGFPAGVIMPLAGVWSAGSGGNFFIVLVVSVLAGLCGSWVLYLAGRFFGGKVLDLYIRWFPKQESKIQEILENVRKRGNKYIFISKLIPVARTIVPIPAGIARVEFMGFTIYSLYGIIIWNTVLISAGFLVGEPIFNWLS